MNEHNAKKGGDSKMKTTTSKTFYHLIVAAVCMGLFSACAAGHKYESLQPISHQPQIESFTINQVDLEGSEFFDTVAGSRALVVHALKAWRQNLYLQAGDLFLAAYRAGKDGGWIWKTDAKIRLLDHSLRAFYLAGAIDKEIQTARYLLSELTSIEKSYLPMETKILCYWATITEETPAFENDVPRALKIADFVPNN
jgi:hypothetical protein